MHKKRQGDGDSGLTEEPSNSPFKSYTEVFETAAPVYIGVYGMTYDQFWRDDPWIAKTMRDAWVARRKAENERDWLLGAYNYQALCTALSNAFRKKGTPAEKYLEKPFPIFPPTKEEIERENAKERAKIEAVYDSLLRQQRQRNQREAEEIAAKEQANAET